MLNTLPPSLVPHSSPQPGSPASPAPFPPASVRRRPSTVRARGGQPSNRNAFKHGLFARKNATPLTYLSDTIRIPQKGLESVPAVLSQVILTLRVHIANLFESSQQATGLHDILAAQRPILRLLNHFLRAQKALARHKQPLCQLQLAASHALDLIRYDFHSSGITRDAYSFREKIKLSDLNSPTIWKDFFSPNPDYPLTFLTSRQWEVLDPLIPPSENILPSALGQGSGVRLSGRPAADPLPLLDAIFWKFAHHARWKDLPAGSPPMLTCRRYYRRLFMSGRLYTIYSALYKDFLSTAELDLPSLVDQGWFLIESHALVLCPGLDDTWQLRTALLFMQQAWQVSRRIIREKDQQHRRHLPHFSYPIRLP
jgi:transposase